MQQLYPLLSMIFVIIIIYGNTTIAEKLPIFTEQDLIENVIWNISNQSNTYVDLLVNYQLQEKNKRGIILHYCDVVLGNFDDASIKHPAFTVGNIYYDPTKSFFVYALCVNMDKYRNGVYAKKFTWNESFKITEYIKKDLTDLNIIRWLPKQSSLDAGTSFHSCDPKKNMANCKFMNFAPNIYSTILNEISNIKLASIYGYKYNSKDSNERAKAIQEFVHRYFHDPEQLEATCNDASIHYLNNKDITGEQSDHCSHPKTYKILDEVIKSSHKLIKKTSMLNTQAIMEWSCDVANDPTIYYKNPLICAMSNKGFVPMHPWSTTSFHNVILNEMMFYNLFLSYYQSVLDDMINLQEIRFSNITTTVEKNTFEPLAVLQEQEFMQQASYQMLRMLENLQANFPIYITLLAYQEDLEKLRKYLARAYTPLHQLYYTLRNTQACN